MSSVEICLRCGATSPVVQSGVCGGCRMNGGGNITKAIRDFIEHGCDRSKMDVRHWAITNRCGVEDVRKEYEKQMSAHSLKASSVGEVWEGK